MTLLAAVGIFVAGIVLNILINIVSSEISDWSPRLAVRVVKRAARALPPSHRGRYEEEWLGELHEIPGKVSKLVVAVSIALRTPALVHVVGGLSLRTRAVQRVLTLLRAAVTQLAAARRAIAFGTGLLAGPLLTLGFFLALGRFGSYRGNPGLPMAMAMFLALAPLYSRLQRRFAELGRRRTSQASSPAPYRPSVDVVVPCYNEDPALLAACLRALRRQDYKGEVRVWVVDDGSGNRDELLPVLDAETGLRQRVLLLDGNYGKREAQAAALREGSGEIVVTIDSDTTIAPDGIRQIVAQLRDPRIGAVTGNLRASNVDATWLTRLIDVRYRLLFERERAAQSYFGTVFCCAGSFSAFRRGAVEQVLPDYLGQQFWGRRRVLGADLKLTNLVLGAGYDSVFEPAAMAATDVPTTLRRFAHQQLTWNRSFYRELPQMLRLLRGRSHYLALDLAGRTLLPALLAMALVATEADALLAPGRVVLDLGALVLMALATLDLAPSLARPEGRRFAVGYALVFVVLLLPTRLWAACTLNFPDPRPPNRRADPPIRMQIAN